MGKLMNLSGKRFGRLVVDSKGKLKYNKGGAWWKCNCDCGNIVEIASAHLRKGDTTSCGCYRREFRRLQLGEASRNRLYYRYKKEAELRKVKFKLSIKQAILFFKGDCRYCGVKPTQVAHAENMYGAYLYNGIDRKDNSIGYIINNCVSCCGTCNHMKHILGEEEFLEHIKRIYNYSIERR